MECPEHRGKYQESAACLVCLAGYWEMKYLKRGEEIAALRNLLAEYNEQIVRMEQERLVRQ